MKKVILSAMVVLVTMITSCAQAQTNENSSASLDHIPVYQLFQTQNMWTFIKLNTRTGQMWQVQYSTKGDDYRFETSLSLTSRVSAEDEMNGRFTLYSTQNIYNFILLDQLDGRTWQVQWSTEAADRAVIPIE